MTTHTDLRSGYDVVVVGARVAGAATAMLLARQGLSVLAIDRAAYGSDTLSTHALMRGGVLQLKRWGLLDRVRAAGTPAVERTWFQYGDRVLEIPIKPRDGVEALYAPRRSFLDALLVDAAREAGADVVHGVRLLDVIQSGGRVRGVLIEDRRRQVAVIRAGTVVGADGVLSAVARLTSAPTTREGRHATGVVYGYWSGLPMEGYHWYFREGVSAGAIQTNDGQMCLFAAMPSRRFMEEVRLDLEAGYRRILSEVSPQLGASLSSARLESRLRGFPGQTGFLRRSWGPGWALVGDAGYFKDPLTAHGITDALRDAELLARAIGQGTDRALAEYETVRDELSLGLFEVTDYIASFEWDLDTLAERHRYMSQEMAREVSALVAIDDAVPLERATAIL
jgi:2-polyprenyl-6-methoxyphenol hydroxylase-like FAD-dependent oxidoreductase